ncbi:hypothetical protein EGT74_03055 [Chitinophaga lutea]|uniref:Uncharacterized protein n=1 Tax=Chitinophaga lutea TaxID=2488634 RepID=A0A3N4Q936_9BACT|nr:hypothetical protein [Chitinophaga lutea]RPE12547.1 hypothetical protein EGT74_03055 [Chitinophaga lutea]
MGETFLFVIICGVFYGLHWMISRFWGLKADYFVFLGLAGSLLLISLFVPLSSAMTIPLALAILFFIALVACWHKREKDQKRREIAARHPERAHRIPGYNEIQEDWFHILLVILSLTAFVVCLAIVVFVLPYSKIIMSSGSSVVP